MKFLRLTIARRSLRHYFIAACAVFIAATATAHHPFGAQYDGSKPVRLVGKLIKVQWTNPHSYFYLEITNPKGEAVEWVLETAAPGALSRRGFKKGDIKVGDTLIVDGFLAKSGAHLADARRVILPDGRTVYGGTSGDGGPGDQAEKKPRRKNPPRRRHPKSQRERIRSAVHARRMLFLADFSRWLHETAWATALRESELVFPVLLIVHVLGLVLLVGSVFVVDLRLLGWRFRTEPALPFIGSLLKVTWAGFALVAASGLPLLAAQAGKLYSNPFLRAKFFLLVLVGLNALVFHRFVSRRIVAWSGTDALPFGARVAASVSLLSWSVLLVVSRYIPLADSP